MVREIRVELVPVKLERVRVTCPACGRQVEAVASDGWVKGCCAVARQSVNYRQDPEYRAQLANIAQLRLRLLEVRASSGRFVKGNVPWNKKVVKSND